MIFKRSFIIFLVSGSIQIFSQIPNLPTIDNPNPQSLFKASNIVSVTTNNKGISKQIPQSNNSDYEKLKRQNETMIKEVNRDIDTQIQAQKEQLYYQQKEREYAQTYLLTPLSDKSGTNAYYSAFENLSKFNPDNFSIADATFVVENAFSNNDKDLQATFQNSIQKAVKIINGQLEKNNVEKSDNMGKNLWSGGLSRDVA